MKDSMEADFLELDWKSQRERFVSYDMASDYSEYRNNNDFKKTEAIDNNDTQTTYYHHHYLYYGQKFCVNEMIH